MEFKITNKLHLKLLFIALIFSIIFHNYLNTIIFNFFKKSMDIFNYSITISFILLIATITMINSCAIFGGKVKYKFKFIYAATEEVSNKPISLTQFTIILLAPITVISLFSLLIPNWIYNLIFISNLIGSIGDLYISIGLIR